MRELSPCVACRRHVSISERACPFCGAAREPSAPAARSFGRASRAAVFAGAALASTACGGKKKPDTLDNQQQTMTSDGGAPQQPDPNQGMDPNDPNNPNNIPMPYGAPPARRRLV